MADGELEAIGFSARYNFTQGKSCVFVISICIFFFVCTKYLSVYAKVYAYVYAKPDDHVQQDLRVLCFNGRASDCPDDQCHKFY